MSIQTISPKQLQDRILAGDDVELIDVRTPAEFREVHVTIAKNAPLESLDCGALLAAHPTNAPLYVICRSGSRGKQACEKIHAAGCTSVVNVEGGTMAWDQAGYPVVRGKKAVSLERQSRPDVRRNHRHMRHGHDPGSHAMEPGTNLTPSCTSQELFDRFRCIVLRLSSHFKFQI
jgi:rhodanese-related sulfurtransferase